MPTMTRNQLRQAVSAGLHAAPSLPSATRQCVTEFAANAKRVMVGKFSNDEGVQCPIRAAHNAAGIDRRCSDAEWEFISAFDSWIDAHIEGSIRDSVIEVTA